MGRKNNKRNTRKNIAKETETDYKVTISLNERFSILNKIQECNHILEPHPTQLRTLMCSKCGHIITKNFVNLDEYNKLRFKKLVDTKIIRFADGEVYVEINENMRGQDVFIIQSTF